MLMIIGIRSCVRAGVDLTLGEDCQSLQATNHAFRLGLRPEPPAVSLERAAADVLGLRCTASELPYPGSGIAETAPQISSSGHMRQLAVGFAVGAGMGAGGCYFFLSGNAGLQRSTAAADTSEAATRGSRV